LLDRAQTDRQLELAAPLLCPSRSARRSCRASPATWRWRAGSGMDDAIAVAAKSSCGFENGKITEYRVTLEVTFILE
jgi:hypothetical protein